LALAVVKVWPCTSIHWPGGSLNACEPIEILLSLTSDGMDAWAMSVARPGSGAKASSTSDDRRPARRRRAAGILGRFKGNPWRGWADEDVRTLRHRPSSKPPASSP